MRTGTGLRRPVVLMYHGFGQRTTAQDPYYLFVPEPALCEQLDLLARRGYRPLDLDGYLAALRAGGLPERSFLVTIDDGYASTLSAARLLADRGVPSVLFLSPAHLGSTSSWMDVMPHEPLLTAAELAGLRDLGMEVGVHGWDHADMAGMSAEDLRRSVVDAREALADLLGYRPRSFAYPRGVHDAAARRAVQDAGYDVAFAVHDGAGRWAVPRLDVNASDVLRSFQVKLLPGYLTGKRLSKHVAPAWRVAHRLVGRAR